MLRSSISSNQTETNLAMPRLVSTLLVLENSDPPWVYVRSTDTHHYTRIPIKIHSVDTDYPLAVDSLLDSGTTGMFIDVEYVRTQKLQTHPLSCAIPIYNIDGTPNEASSIKEEVDLICTLEITQNMPHFWLPVWRAWGLSWNTLGSLNTIQRQIGKQVK